MIFTASNHQGSLAATLTNTSTTTYLRYRPYGDQRGPGTAPNERAFLNQTKDTAQSLTYLNQRSVDTRTGTFTTVDPLAVKTRDPYIYANANPTGLSDPSGLCAKGSYRVDGECVKPKRRLTIKRALQIGVSALEAEPDRPRRKDGVVVVPGAGLGGNNFQGGLDPYLTGQIIECNASELCAYQTVTILDNGLSTTVSTGGPSALDAILKELACLPAASGGPCATLEGLNAIGNQRSKTTVDSDLRFATEQTIAVVNWHRSEDGTLVFDDYQITNAKVLVGYNSDDAKDEYDKGVSEGGNSATLELIPPVGTTLVVEASRWVFEPYHEDLYTGRRGKYDPFEWPAVNVGS